MEFPTGIGTSDATSIHLLGYDLAGELMGNIGFGELALWLATQQRPTQQQVCVFEAVLVSLADHGFTPTAIAARLTLYSVPARLHGAMADIGLAPELLRGVDLLARAAGLLGHIAEEMRHPIAPDIYAAIDRNAAYRPTVSNDITEQH